MQNSTGANQSMLMAFLAADAESTIRCWSKHTDMLVYKHSGFVNQQQKQEGNQHIPLIPGYQFSSLVLVVHWPPVEIFLRLKTHLVNTHLALLNKLSAFTCINSIYMGIQRLGQKQSLQNYFKNS